MVVTLKWSMQFTSPIIMLYLKLQKVKIFSPPAAKKSGEVRKQAGLGVGKRFRNSSIKRKEKQKNFQILLKKCGRGGIRTRGPIAGTLLFESSTFNRSVTLPKTF